MSAGRQWLVVPANHDTVCYVTKNPDVAAKRAAKGDYVDEITREPGVAAPGYTRFTVPKLEDDEL